MSDNELMLDVGQANEIKLAARRAGATNADLKKLSEGTTFAQVLPFLKGKAQIIMNSDEECTAPQPTTYPVEIDYADTFEQRLAAGCYGWKDSDITEKHFPVKGEGKVGVDLELAHYAKTMNTEAVLTAIDAQGYCPAIIEELLAFGATYPELQCEFPIVALGSVWRRRLGRRGVACLYRGGGVRYLSLYRVGFDWHARCRFLVVRRSAELTTGG